MQLGKLQSFGLGPTVRPKVRGPQRIKTPSHTQTKTVRSRLPAGITIFL